MSQQPPPAPVSNQPTSSCSSAYPLPPMRYISLYTDENISLGRVPEPPKPITEGTYSMFGHQIVIDDAIIRPLESQGFRRLYPREYDHKRELKKINASILVNFLDLLDVVVRCPDTNKREEKCLDIQLLFITVISLVYMINLELLIFVMFQMHHLINELRPHQARETIRVTLQAQRRQRHETNARLNKQIDRVNEIVQNCINSIPESTDISAEIQSLIDFKIPIEKEDDDKIDKNDDEEFQCEMNQLDALMCSFVDEISDK